MSDAAKKVFVSYWDTPGSPAEEDIVPAAQRAHPTLQDDDSPLKGAQDPDKLAPVNPDLHEEEEVVGVVDSGKVVAASRGA